MMVKYASPSDAMCLRCVMLTLSGPVEFVCFPIDVPVCVVCFMFDCVGELFVECVCYMYGSGVCFLFESDCVIFYLCFFRWLIRVWSSKKYLSCVCDPSVCLCVPSICQIYVFV